MRPWYPTYTFVSREQYYGGQNIFTHETSAKWVDNKVIDPQISDAFSEALMLWIFCLIQNLNSLVYAYFPNIMYNNEYK